MERFPFFGKLTMEEDKKNFTEEESVQRKNTADESAKRKQRLCYLRIQAAKQLIGMYVLGVLLAVGILTAVLFVYGIRLYAVVTDSMEPTVHIGSVCFINMAYPYNDIEKNDIIAYHNGGLLVTHRVESVEKNGLITKGDAAENNDTVLVTRHNFGGKLIFVIPYLGYAAIFLRTKAGLCVGAVLFIAFLCIKPLQS